jgi:protein-L-isoaspartate(D-aspartate) O-methyltransferase
MEDEPKNWLLNPDLVEGEAGWEGRPAGQAVWDAAAAEGHPAVLLSQAPGSAEALRWTQCVAGLPARRQVLLTARVRVEEGEAWLWVRCFQADGTEIRGGYLRSAAPARVAEGWQPLEFAFVVPRDTAMVEVGGAIPHAGRTWFNGFALRLVPDDEERLRAALVETIGREGKMPTAACRRAFLRVARHRFVPDSSLAEAYSNQAIPVYFPDADGRRIGPTSSSEPALMATMLGQLRLRPGLRVLEIGAGTGYNAALLAEIVGAENVTSIDIDEEIVAAARAHLDAAGFPRVFVALADGWDGYRDHAPYDRIIVTVGVHDLSPAWVEQLRDGGILLAPLSFRAAQFTAALRKRDGRLLSEAISPAYFMDLRGKHPRSVDHAGGSAEDRFYVTSDALDEAALTALDEILHLPREPFAAPELALQGHDEVVGLQTYLSLAHPMALSLRGPRLRAHGIEDSTYALADLARRQLAIPTGCFGGREIGEELCRLARAWQALGRPGIDRLVLAAYPRAAYPDADRLPRGRWMGLLQKEHTWFQWRYR